MKIYCRKLGVVAYQNKNNNIKEFQNWYEKLSLKDWSFDINKKTTYLEIKIFSEYGYEKTLYLFQNNWIVLESDNFKEYTDKEFKRLFREI